MFNFSTFEWQTALANGSIFSVALGLVILGSLAFNARLWLNDYPKPIRERVAPLSTAEKRDRGIVSMLFLGVLVGGLLFVVAQLRTIEGISFGAAYLHLFVILAMFNLFDAVVIDLLVITLLKPKFVIIPGAEDLVYLFHDYRKHMTDFLKGMVFCAVASLPFALLVVL
jgi:hypothetical protein